ncbi:MAG: iron-containing alcohol dehydrogenase, partial [Endomicrobia bacterium]|nr:iron-containing alcohol dehydrogenase [Endomicrobiia bacterium]
LPAVIKNPEDILAREKISLASLYGGMMIVNSGLTLAHGIGSVIGPRFALPHGLACGIFLPEVIELNLECLSLQKRKVIEELFSRDIKSFFQNFYTIVGIDTKLKCTTKVNFADLARQILNTSSAKGNLKQLTEEELIKLLFSKIYI